MQHLQFQIQKILEQELARKATISLISARVSEAVFGFAVDNPDISQELILETLAVLSQPARSVLQEIIETAKRIFFENETLEVNIRERVLERRKPQRASAIELACNNDLEGLRRVGARALQIGLQVAKSEDAAIIIKAWEHLSLYERGHT